MGSPESLGPAGGEKGQVNQSAADIYNQFFLPALFQQWPAKIAELIKPQPHHEILDVACGTGVLAKHMARLLKNPKQVSAVDINDGMLSVAKLSAPEINWHKAPAENLSYDDESFDIVCSQFGLMFFGDRVKAIEEMIRVLKPGGRLAIAVFDSLDRTPGYDAVVKLLTRLFGRDIADELRAPYTLGDKQMFGGLFEQAGVRNLEIHTLNGSARFNSIQDWMYTDVKGWTLADKINGEQFELLLREAISALSAFIIEDGSVKFDAPAHVAVVDK